MRPCPVAGVRKPQFLYAAHVPEVCCPGRDPGGLGGRRPPPWRPACSLQAWLLPLSTLRTARLVALAHRLSMVSNRAAISAISQSIQASAKGRHTPR